MLNPFLWVNWGFEYIPHLASSTFTIRIFVNHHPAWCELLDFSHQVFEKLLMIFRELAGSIIPTRNYGSFFKNNGKQWWTLPTGHFQENIFSGWWLSPTPLNDGVRQIGSSHWGARRASCNWITSSRVAAWLLTWIGQVLSTIFIWNWRVKSCSKWIAV